MSRDAPVTSSVRRFLKLGGLVGRVGSSVLAEGLVDLARSAPSKEEHRTANLVKNASRVVETLGEMKGAAMKVGQMLSLHESLLPPEVSEVLRALQQEAPRVPFEVIQYEIRGALPDYDELFEHLEPEAFAAASIGQVHRGVLRDGREVAVKIQYPLIEEIVRADLNNLRRLMRYLVSLFSEAEFEPLWEEIRDQLLEELDYEQEMENIERMAALHAEIPEIVIPGVVREASSRRVLTMEYVGGSPHGEAVSRHTPIELRNSWAAALYEFQMRGLFEHRLLHADPNLANFAFRSDGSLVVYDFGCVKRVPAAVAAGYARILTATLEDRRQEIPGILQDLGAHRTSGEPLELEIMTPYLDLLEGMLREEPPYRFGEEIDLYQRIFDLGAENVGELRDVRFPSDIIFIDRSLAGHFGNLIRLGAEGPWRALALHYARQALAEA